MGFTLSDTSMTTVSGSTANAGYSIQLSTYYIVGETMTYESGGVRWRDLYSYLFGNLTNNLVISEVALHSMMDGTDRAVHQICLGVNVHHGLYALMSVAKNINIPAPEIGTPFGELLTTLKTSVTGLFGNEISWSGAQAPNQIEYIEDKQDGDYYYIPINPIKDTVRRTLAYTNYIADGNTAIDAEAGNPVSSAFSYSTWAGSWFVSGELRASWTWPRRLQGALSKDDIPNCSNAEIGVTSTYFTSTWKGIETFKKVENSVAWIPGELYHWPCSVMYRFYSAASWVDNTSTCRGRRLPVGFLFPLTITSPTSAMGFQSGLSLEYLSLYTTSQDFVSSYGRPYEDDSDGSGVWHQMA